jgi:4-amino-4-deoxy-L-arabinose transferase-like glycosyltransferase
MPKKTQPFVLVAAVFLILCAPTLFSEGMFMDGLIYASVAHNLAEGMGSFWQPHYSEFLFNHFYEHPPLAMGLQSIWFKLFGSSLLIERFYSLFCYLLTGMAIVFCWKQLQLPLHKAWLPLLLWISVPNMAWACSNNMLENTMMVFTTLSLLFYLKSLHNKWGLWLALSGMALSLAFLSKGFFALYLWALPGCLWIAGKQLNLKRAMRDTLLLITCTVLPLLLCMWLWPEARTNLESYVQHQVMGSIEKVQTVNSRFAIVGEFLMGILPAVCIGVLLWLIARRPSLSGFKKNMAMALFLLCLCGVLPIMVSLKQRGFYILTVYPFFALAAAMVLLPLTTSFERFWEGQKRQQWLVGISLIVMVLAIGLNYYFAQTVGRDADKIEDVRTVLKKTGTDVTIGLCASEYQDWSLHAYFQRYGQLSLNARTPYQYGYYLSPKTGCRDVPVNRYQAVSLPLHNYTLYKSEEPMR